MQQALRYEAEYFDEKKRLLRAIFNETINHCCEAYRSKNIPQDKCLEMCLKKDDEHYIRAMIENPISIVLLGNRPCVKARIVNYILGYELLPVFDFYDPDYNQSRRPVRIMYGTQRRHAFCLRNFELVDNIPTHTERVVSFDDLRFDSARASRSRSGTGTGRLNAMSSFSSASIGLHQSGKLQSSSSSSSANSGTSHGTVRSSITTSSGTNNSTSSFKSFLQHPLVGNFSNSSHGIGLQQPSQQSSVSAGIGPSTGIGSVSAAAAAAVASEKSKQTRFQDIDLIDHGYADDDDDEDEDEDDQDDDGPGKIGEDMATLDIVLPHELLEKNLQIRVAADIEDFNLIYRTSFHKVNPIIVYCFERYDDKLSPVDVSHLEQLRLKMPCSPILFAHIVDFDPTYHSCMAVPSATVLSNYYSHSQHPHNHHHQQHYQQQSQPQSRSNLLVPQPSTSPTNNRVNHNSSKLKSNDPNVIPSLSVSPSGVCNLISELTESEQQQQWFVSASPNLTLPPPSVSSVAAQSPAFLQPPGGTPPALQHLNSNQLYHSPPQTIINDSPFGRVSPCPITPITPTSCSCHSSVPHHQPVPEVDVPFNVNPSQPTSTPTRTATVPSKRPVFDFLNPHHHPHHYQHQHHHSQPCVVVGQDQLANGNFLRASESLWHQLREMGFFQETPSSSALKAPRDRQEKRLSNGYYIVNDRPFKCVKQNADHGLDVSSRFLCHSYEFCYFVDFFRAILKSNLVVASTLLNEIHNQFIQYYIFSAFDMTWNLNYSIPKRLEYAQTKEAELYMSLMGIANRKQEEIRQLIEEMLEFMRDDILNQASAYRFLNPNLNHSADRVPGQTPQVVLSTTDLKNGAEEIQEFVFEMLNRAIAVKLISSVDVMRETFIGTLQRCLKMLENFRPEKASTTTGGSTCNGTEKAQIRPEEKIDYALSRLLDSAYSIEINVNTCNSIIRIFWERMKQFFKAFTFSWRQNTVIDADWKRWVAADLIDNLSEAKLAKCICTQFREKLKVAHETFVSSLASLETALMSKMKETDHRRQKVRKNDAPIFARLALESTSFIDSILYGTPELSKEIGRGQYGVVFSTKKSWAQYSRIAVKSIMICDDKHWNDLSMEFYYTRSLPENDRIVQIRGSIIEHNYNGTSSYVYLIMDRLSRDLYAGLKAGLDWLQRLQIALDVVHGLRFLHNHGLIHRDIKLKNVLLDRRNRAKITDLGFCKSEVMISGSIVGTPIHMAPEVFTGKYDSMVDIYAFGILFWYICAGSVELPQIFEQCHNKDHLWIAVKKGLRPEKLPIFDDECYSLMEQCWSGDLNKRPILGEVDLKLNRIRDRFVVMSNNSNSNNSGTSPINIGGGNLTPITPISLVSSQQQHQQKHQSMISNK